jgi:hypothetical protein
VYVPEAVALTVRVVLFVRPDFSIKLVRPGVAVRPAEGFETSEIVPANPFRLVTVIVEVPVFPISNGPTVVGAAAMLKSLTVTVIVPVVWTSAPLVPVTVAV